MTTGMTTRWITETKCRRTAKTTSATRMKKSLARWVILKASPETLVSLRSSWATMRMRKMRIWMRTRTSLVMRMKLIPMISMTSKNRSKILDEDGNPVEDDAKFWLGSDTDEDEEDEEEIDYEAAHQDLDEAHIHAMDPDQLGRFNDLPFDDRFIDEGIEEDGESFPVISDRVFLTVSR